MCNLFRKKVSVIGGVTGERLRHLSPCSVYLFDSTYWYPDVQGWANILTDVLFGMPAFVDELWDCDNFALEVKARVAIRYKINAMGIVIGNSPQGYHAWNAYVSGGLLLYLEPQTGEIWERDSSYQPDLILW